MNEYQPIGREIGVALRGGEAVRAEDITVRYGGLAALSGVTFSVSYGEVVGLVGPNGAGKSTLFSVLSGLTRPSSGRVFINGNDVTTATPQARARLGMARTFQHPELFGDMTVRDHVRLSYRMRRREGKYKFFGADRQSESRAVGEIVELLNLESVSGDAALGLPLSTSRLVEIGRAIASGPDVILLDEPFAGLDMAERDLLSKCLRVLRERGLSMVLVEHDLEMVLGLCDRVYVLDFGIRIAVGTPSEVRQDVTVKSAYLGGPIS